QRPRALREAFFDGSSLNPVSTRTIERCRCIVSCMETVNSACRTFSPASRRPTLASETDVAGSCRAGRSRPVARTRQPASRERNPMLDQIRGIHHITSLASDASVNNRFFTGTPGLRRVKKTVNFDAPDIYHLYYADEVGTPGTVMTYFPF